MIKTVILLPDGRELSSGTYGQAAIAGCTVTECVNSGTELTLGSVCAAMAEVKLLVPDGQLPIAAGDRLILCQQEGTTRQQLGIFIAEKPVRTGAHTATVTAYDRVTLLDKDLTAWLKTLNSWPYSLQTLATMVCDACGLELEEIQLPNGSFPVEKFLAAGITGRKLIQWIAEAAGCFCRATAAGKLEFCWYTPTELYLGPKATATGWEYADGVLTCTDPDVTVQAQGDTLILEAPHWALAEEAGDMQITAATRQYYFSGSLSYEDYAVAPIEKVQIRRDAEERGTFWPDDPLTTNAYQITGNLLLAGATMQQLRGVGKTLYEQLKDVTYTPCRVSLPADTPLRAGQILYITDPEGRRFSTYIMTCKRAGQRMTLESTGSPSRVSVTAANTQTFEALSGKVLTLHTNIDGIRAENKDARGKLSALALTVDGLSARVEKQNTENDNLHRAISELRQTAEAVQIAVERVEQEGVASVRTGMGYTFDDKGLKIAHTGQQIENLLDNTGMYVTRGGQTILQANNDGVTAADVAVRNYLIVGNSRLEGYEGNRTACFYIGG